MYGEVEANSEFFMAPQVVAVEHCTDYNVAGFPLEFECLDDGQGPKTQNCELECEGGGERHRREDAAMDGIEPVVQTLAQNWSSMDRKGQYERVDCHQTTHAQLGWSCCQDGPQRNLCEGLEMPRSSEVEKDKWSGPHPQRFKLYRWEDTVAGKVSKFTGIADGLSESVQDNTEKLETVFEMWKDP